SVPDADAERCEAVPSAAAAELVQQGHYEARPAHPERMAERDRAAVDVDALGVEAELADHDQALRCERLVELDEIEVLNLHPRAIEQLPNRRHGPDSHHPRIDACDGRADERAQRLDPQLLRALFARDHE